MHENNDASLPQWRLAGTKQFPVWVLIHENRTVMAELRGHVESKAESVNRVKGIA